MTEYNVTIIKTERRTISIQVKCGDKVVVRAPKSMSQREIDAFVKEHEAWIKKHLGRMKAVNPSFTKEELTSFANRAKKVIPPKVAAYAQMLGVEYGRITIRAQRTRWGSCSGKGNLNFNCLLMMVPEEVLDYVIVHELCHLREMNHSKNFWNLVEQAMPDYRRRKLWLKEHGSLLIGRIE